MKKTPRAPLPRRDIVVTFSDADRRKLGDLLSVKGGEQRKDTLDRLSVLLSHHATTIANTDLSVLFVSDTIAALRPVAKHAAKLADAVERMDPMLRENFAVGHVEDVLKPAIDFESLAFILESIRQQFMWKQSEGNRKRGLERGQYRDEKSREARAALERFFDACVPGKAAQRRREFVDKTLAIASDAIAETRAATS